MSFELGDNIEKEESGRDKLLRLEREGVFVFHGSPEAVKDIEPRQAYNENLETGEKEKDGAPAVFATPFADVAIFRALINTVGVEGDSTSRFGIEDGIIHFESTQNLLDRAKDKNGFVYVLKKEQFDEPIGTQCRSEESVSPVEIVEVSVEDLTKDIKIIDT